MSDAHKRRMLLNTMAEEIFRGPEARGVGDIDETLVTALLVLIDQLDDVKHQLNEFKAYMTGKKI